MTVRTSLLPGLGLVVAASLAAGDTSAQSRPGTREDLLDELTRHIQICSEISESQQRLACYDKVQTHVGDVPQRAPQPTPLASNPPPANRPPASAPPPGAAAPSPLSGGGSYSSQQLAPPPLNVPGGGVATLGGSGSGQAPPGTMPPPPPQQDYASAGPRPQPRLTRTGPRPVPYSSQPHPLVTLRAFDLTYGASRYWQVTIAVTSNTSRSVDAQVQCTFVNGDSPVGDATFGPAPIAPGEQITTDLIGPPTSTHVDSTNCRVLSP